MKELSSYKLFIWDLDETLWQGTLSDGDVFFPEDNINLIKNMVDTGVMCSICSKNDEEKVQKVLDEYELGELFVFNSINWSPKGQRVKHIIESMNLRDVNVMFIDDNPSNCAEVEHSCEKITVSDEAIIPQLVSYYQNCPKKDLSHSRLKQYKILEEKQKFQSKIGSNEEFLAISNIKVEIHNDCMNHIDRIGDLILRSNQLNFTKKRSSQEELTQLFEEKDINAGYVSVKDNFGDYGIVGFFAVKNNQLEHFVFSCRTLGMGIEQYVYKCLGYPKIDIEGEVSSDLLLPDPYWVNCEETKESNKKNAVSSKMLIKGPCDMSQMFAYISESDNILTEFTFVNNTGVVVENRNHTVNILNSITMDYTTKERLVNELPFGDELMFESDIFDPEMGIVVFSLLSEPHLGLYREKNSGNIIAFGEYVHDLTDKSKWSRYVDQTIPLARCNFTLDFLQRFSEEYEYIGRLQPEDVINNLKLILSKMADDAILVLGLGSETAYNQKQKEVYINRHLYHRELNQKVRDWAETNDKVFLLDVNSFIENQESFTNGINHFSRKVYYEMSNQLISIINSTNSRHMSQHSRRSAELIHLKNDLRNKVQRIFGK